MRRLIVDISLIAIITVAIVGASELLLQFAGRMSPAIGAYVFPNDVPEVIADDKLIVKGNPYFPGFDSNGWYNKTLSKTANIVAIGDSQTYATSVPYSKAWPRVLAGLTSCRVYTMAQGLYGPLQYSILAKRAAKLKPSVILVAIYFGNDFFDNWEMYIRNPVRYKVPKKLRDEAWERERVRPLREEAFAYYQSSETPTEDGTLSSLRNLGSKSAIWGLANSMKERLLESRQNNVWDREIFKANFEQAVPRLTPHQLEFGSIFEGENWKTILTSRYRYSAEDISDPRIRVGVWLTKWAVNNISEFSNRRGIRTIFILLPTKESVFAEKIKNKNDHAYLQKLARDENMHRLDLIEYMEKDGIDYVDMTPFLRSVARQPYFEDADGHPNSFGQSEIAAKVLDKLDSAIGTERLRCLVKLDAVRSKNSK